MVNTTDLSAIEDFPVGETRFLITRADMEEILLMDAELQSNAETISIFQEREDYWKDEITSITDERDRLETIVYLEGGALCVTFVAFCLALFF